MLPNPKLLARLSRRDRSTQSDFSRDGKNSQHSPGFALLEVRDLRVTYSSRDKKHVAISGLNVQIGSSEIVGIFGPSGSGKTSLGLALLNLLPETATRRADTIRFRGRDLLHLDEAEMRSIRGREISIMYQEPTLALNPVMRVGDQIGEVVRAHSGINRRERRERVWELLCSVSLDQRPGVYDAYPHELSGGERHRVIIAQALACHPFLVIADEPTAGLDAELKPEIMELIGRLRSDLKVSFLLISHDRKMLAQVADRTLEMSAGRLHQPTIKPTVPSPRKITFGSPFVSSPNEDKPLIAIQHLSKSYRQRAGSFHSDGVVPVLQDVNLVIPRGSNLGLVGPSGSGKSTLARCLALWESIDAGKIYFCGKSIADLPVNEACQIRPRIQLVLQDSAAAFNPNFTAEEIVEEPLLIQGDATKQQRKAAVHELLDETDLRSDIYTRKALELSGGQRQRLAIARALILNPELIIFDESTTGIDLETRHQIVALLGRLKRARNLTYLFISHDFDFLQQHVEEVLTMRQGTIVRKESAEALFAAQHDASLQVTVETRPIATGGAK